MHRLLARFATAWQAAEQTKGQNDAGDFRALCFLFLDGRHSAKLAMRTRDSLRLVSADFRYQVFIPHRGSVAH